MHRWLPHLQALRKSVRHLLWALWPELCPGCRVACCATDTLLLCPLCRASFVRNEGVRCRACDGPAARGQRCQCVLQAGAPILRAVRVPWRYTGALAQLVVAGKYQGARHVFTALGQLLANDPQVRALVLDAGALVPVPLAPARLRLRGYNPCALLAHALAQAVGQGAPAVVSALVRTDAQAPRSFDDRLARLLTPPTFVGNAKPAPRPLLIDDVLTTGGTLQAAASALCRAGSVPPSAVAVARRA